MRKVLNLNALTASSQDHGRSDHSKQCSAALEAIVASLEELSKEEKDAVEAPITLHAHDMDNQNTVSFLKMRPIVKN